VGPTTEELAQATEFFQIWNEMVQLTLGRPELEIQTPLLELDAWQVIDLGFQVNAPLDKTWSCVEDQAGACGACRGCRARDAAFMQAAKPDPMKPARK
jgi:7-cyano-7-deazaguanine synthase